MVTKPTSATSTTTSEKNNKINNCISQFFRPKPEPIFYRGANRFRTEENNNDVIVLDDDSDDDHDGNNIGIVDLSGGLEPKNLRIEKCLTVETNDNGERDVEKSSVLQEKKIFLSKCDEDVVQDKMKKNNDLNHSHDTGLKQNLISSPQESSMVVKNKENPFAKFAHGASLASESPFENGTRTPWHQHSSSSRNNKRSSSCGNDNGDNHNASCSKKCRTSLKDGKKKEKEFVKMRDISPEEQIKIVRKWHSMADPLASLEVRRYQILMAARLHARCQESTVRKAILKLREHFAFMSEAKMITVEEMAKSDPEELASHISSLQFFNVKAKHIVKAAQEIQSRHGGIVPEDEFSLLQITGIGKTFADLLSFVNKRETHERLISQAMTTFPN